MAYNVAVDVGGTFTDVLVFDEGSGELTEGKVLSTPDDPSRGVVEGMERVCEKVGIGFSDLRLLFHGTTVVTNMILTNTGSRVGLLTTKGHEQILYLARAWTPGPLYGWMALQKPDPPADLTDTGAYPSAWRPTAPSSLILTRTRCVGPSRTSWTGASSRSPLAS
jgi:N-methylhydantoinase A